MISEFKFQRSKTVKFEQNITSVTDTTLSFPGTALLMAFVIS